jgi:hypothetical protein
MYGTPCNYILYTDFWELVAITHVANDHIHFGFDCLRVIFWHIVVLDLRDFENHHYCLRSIILAGDFVSKLEETIDDPRAH